MRAPGVAGAAQQAREHPEPRAPTRRVRLRRARGAASPCRRVARFYRVCWRRGPAGRAAVAAEGGGGDGGAFGRRGGTRVLADVLPVGSDRGAVDGQLGEGVVGVGEGRSGGDRQCEDGAGWLHLREEACVNRRLASRDRLVGMIETKD